MDPRRKKELRSLIHLVPKLVKARLVNQAFETEKIIASTFEFTDSFQSLMHNIPQNHIEKIADYYSNLSMKAFQGGINNAKEKLKTKNIENTDGPELDEEIKTKIPMPYTLSQHLAKTFQDHTGRHLETVPNAGEIYVQFKQDLENAYRDWVKEYYVTQLEAEDDAPEEPAEPATTQDSPDEEEETYVGEDEYVEDEEDEAMMEPAGPDDAGGDYEEELEEDDEESSAAFLRDWLSEIEDKPSDKRNNRYDPIEEPIDTTTGGIKTMDEKKLASKLKKDPILADVSANEVIKALEEYTKIPGDSTAENVLRFELGLPPKKATAESGSEEVEAKVRPRRRVRASVKRRVKGDRVIGPYDTQVLKGKILSAVKTHVIDDSDLQTVVIDPVVAGIGNMSESEAAHAIAKKVDLTEALAAEATLQDVKNRADVLATKLTKSVGLPGDLVFLDVGGDYMLTFAFHRTDAADLADQTGSTMQASRRKAKAAKSAKQRPIPNGPQGVITKASKDQIEKLAALGKSKTLRDIRKASAKVAAYMNDVLKSIRTGRVGMAEGSSKLRANMADVIAEVFGADGQGYYEYLTKSKKKK